MKTAFEEWTVKLYEIERDFYGSFSGIHRGDGFKLYHRMEYGNITDCNHAVLDLSNKYFRRPDVIQASLDEVEAFYEFVGLTPRLYQGFYEGEFELLQPLLIERGYTVETFKETELYVFDPTVFESDLLTHVPNLQEGFKEITSAQSLTSAIFKDIDGHDEWHEILSEMLESCKYRVFALVHGNEVIALATAQYFGTYCRIDHVKTAQKHQSKGYCHGLMHFMMQKLTSEQPEATYYLYASKPEAIKPYLKSGFRRIEMKEFIWGAWKSQNELR